MGFKRIAFMFMLVCAMVCMGHHATPDPKDGEAQGAPILLPGDSAGIGCGPNLHFDKADFSFDDMGKSNDDSTYSLGCNVEVQVSFVKLFAGINTVSGVDPGDVEVEAGFLAPLGDNTRLSVSLDGNTGYEQDMYKVDGSFTVQSRVVWVF